MQVLTPGGVITVCYQVDSDEARAFVIPIGEGADGNSSFQQRAGLGGAESVALGVGTCAVQQTIGGGRTHLQQQPSCLGIKL